ncbi:MAPEG family protein [Phormidium yuhuli AB48]|uniref:MAPEG family protein n=1 Tax=Phormidium yuhuli AB48 TaxID=2940671 RepID=A0ABY5AYD2_9CYAN|nr:MAPEG family protein [Phormidium yuhuli]USR93078.1 MAPEG family protein [Phormidium yuhuli AB48]
MVIQWSDSLILLLAIALAAVLIYLPYLLVGYARFRVGYDLAAPRAMFDRLPAYAQRATWAHQNSFETFLPFAAAALIAYVTHGESATTTWAALIFLAARVVYSGCYIFNVPLVRSASFVIGSLATLVLFAVGLDAAGLNFGF